MKQLIIGFDVDDVLAQFVPALIRQYNRLHGDTVSPEQVTDWDLTKTLTKARKEDIEYIYTHPIFYLDVEATAGALTVVNECRKYGRVIFVTSCHENTEGPKYRWLVRHGFLEKGHGARKDFFPVNDKGLVACDLLFDDNVTNVVNAYRHGVLVDMPHNRSRRNEVAVALGEGKGISEVPEFVECYARGLPLSSWFQRPNPWQL